MNSRQFFLTFSMLIVGVLTAGAQDRSTLVQQMNEIKMNDEVYMWEQCTDNNADTAKVKATEWLLRSEINKDRPQNEQLTVEEVMPYLNYIRIDRHSNVQYFVYIKRDDAWNLRKSTLSSTTSIHTNQKKSSSTSTEKSIAAASISADSQQISKPKPSFIPDAFVQKIMNAKQFTNVYKLLQALKADGEILQFGKLSDVDDYSSLDLILFDMQSQDAITMLSAESDQKKRTNLVNGMEDSLGNYPQEMTAVIWYIRH